MTYFDACDTLDDLKAAYKRLALKYHPDCGGDLRTMQEVNAEYDDAFAVLKRERNARAKDPESRVRPTTEAPEEFRAIVEALLKLDGLDVELCGSWLWIGGDTYRHRKALKEAGCMFSRSKRRWYWRHAEDSRPFSRGSYSMGEIRSAYGSERFERRDEDERRALKRGA